MVDAKSPPLPRCSGYRIPFSCRIHEQYPKLNDARYYTNRGSVLARVFSLMFSSPQLLVSIPLEPTTPVAHNSNRYRAFAQRGSMSDPKPSCTPKHLPTQARRTSVAVIVTQCVALAWKGFWFYCCERIQLFVACQQSLEQTCLTALVSTLSFVVASSVHPTIPRGVMFSVCPHFNGRRHSPD